MEIASDLGNGGGILYQERFLDKNNIDINSESGTNLTKLKRKIIVALIERITDDV